MPTDWTDDEIIRKIVTHPGFFLDIDWSKKD